MTLLWIPLTIAAAFLQNVRSALQKHLKGELGTIGATFVRFGYGFPFALLYLAALVLLFDFELPRLNNDFLAFAAVGGLAQILATALLVTLFDARNFAVGTTYSKTETVQAAVFALVFLGESISTAATVGILVSLVGVIAISAPRAGRPRRNCQILAGAPGIDRAGFRCLLRRGRRLLSRCVALTRR